MMVQEVEYAVDRASEEPMPSWLVTILEGGRTGNSTRRALGLLYCTSQLDLFSPILCSESAMESTNSRGKGLICAEFVRAGRAWQETGQEERKS